METNKNILAEFDSVGGKYEDMVNKALSLESSHEYFESYDGLQKIRPSRFEKASFASKILD